MPNEDGTDKAGNRALTLIEQHLKNSDVAAAEARADNRELRQDIDAMGKETRHTLAALNERISAIMRQLYGHVADRAKLQTGALVAVVVVLLGAIGALAVMLLNARAPL